MIIVSQPAQGLKCLTMIRHEDNVDLYLCVQGRKMCIVKFRNNTDFILIQKSPKVTINSIVLI